MVRRAYRIQLIVNEVSITRVVIDPHYEIKHRASVNDEVILELIAQLGHGDFLPDGVDEHGFQYFTSDLWTRGKHYRLV